MTVAIAVAGLLVAPGCGAIIGIFSGGERDEEQEAQLRERQDTVMRFADEFAGRVLEAGIKAERSIGTSGARAELRAWQLSQITSAFVVAAGQNPVINGLDMIVLTTLDHAVVQDSWVPRYGQAVQPLLEAHDWLEQKAWSMGKQMLTARQAEELRQMIDEWRRNNPKVRSVGFVHFRDFSKSIGKQATGGDGGPGSLFGLVGLDPLSNLDPAVRELAENRLLAERALFYGQRVPLLLDLQISHVTREAADMPESRQLLASVSEVSASVARVTDTVDGLPGLIEREREAAIDQILERLESKEADARAVLTDARATLEVGTETAAALERAIRSLDGLVARFEREDEPKREQARSKPFDIDAYTAAAAEVSLAARDLEFLISTLGRTAPQLGEGLDTASEASKRVIDHAFVRALTLLALTLCGGLAAALVYKYLAIRLQRR